MIRMTLRHLRSILSEASSKSNVKRAADEFLATVRNSIAQYIDHDYKQESEAYAEQLAESSAEEFISTHWSECSEWAKLAFSGEQPPVALKRFNDTWRDNSDPFDRMFAVVRYEFFTALENYVQTGVNMYDPNVMAMREKHKNWKPPVNDYESYDYTDYDDEADAKDFNARVNADYGSVWRDVKKGDVIRFSPVTSVVSAATAALRDMPDMVTGTVDGILRGKVVFTDNVNVPSEYHLRRVVEQNEFVFSTPWKGAVDVESWAYGYREYYRLEKQMSWLTNLLLKNSKFASAVQSKVDTFHAVEIIERAPTRDVFDVRGFKKADLICYVLDVLGPMRKDDVLKVVASLEDKPYKQGSNVTYFAAHPVGIVGDTIDKAGTAPRGAFLYDVTDKGREAAAPIRSRLGDEPAKKFAGQGI